MNWEPFNSWVEILGPGGRFLEFQIFRSALLPFLFHSYHWLSSRSQDVSPCLLKSFFSTRWPLPLVNWSVWLYVYMCITTRDPVSWNYKPTLLSRAHQLVDEMLGNPLAAIASVQGCDLYECLSGVWKPSWVATPETPTLMRAVFAMSGSFLCFPPGVCNVVPLLRVWKIKRQPPIPIINGGDGQLMTPKNFGPNHFSNF